MVIAERCAKATEPPPSISERSRARLAQNAENYDNRIPRKGIKLEGGFTKKSVPPQLKWIDQLKDIHQGETCFLLGNGWSIKYYRPELFRKMNGVLIGCNKSYTAYPLHYLIWQDTKVSELCTQFEGTKLMPIRKKERVRRIDYDNTYFFGFGKYGKFRDACTLELSNSGCLAFQMAHHMGFGTVILVGCDCAFEKLGSPGNTTLRSNIFDDRLLRDTGASQRKNYVKEVGTKKGRVLTASNLKGFAKKFHELYRRYRDDMDIFRMGDHGILEDIPVIDFEPFHSDQHPKGKHG